MGLSNATQLHLKTKPTLVLPGNPLIQQATHHQFPVGFFLKIHAWVCPKSLSSVEVANADICTSISTQMFKRGEWKHGAYGWFPWLLSWNYINTVNRLHLNTKWKVVLESIYVYVWDGETWFIQHLMNASCLASTGCTARPVPRPSLSFLKEHKSTDGSAYVCM